MVGVLHPILGPTAPSPYSGSGPSAQAAAAQPAVEADPDLMHDLQGCWSSRARLGDPEAPLRWASQEPAPALPTMLQAQGHQISRTLVGELLHALGFSRARHNATDPRVIG